MKQLRQMLTNHIAGLSWPVKMTSFMMKHVRHMLIMCLNKLLPHSFAVPGQLRRPAYGETAQINIDHDLTKTVTVQLGCSFQPVKKTSFIERQLRLILTSLRKTVTSQLGCPWPVKRTSFMTRQLRLILTKVSEKLLPHSWAVPGQLRGQAL